MARFYEGQLVWWLYTEGGGGGSGHRANRKSRRPAVFLREGKGRSQIRTEDTLNRVTWVSTALLEPRDAVFVATMDSERKRWVAVGRTEAEARQALYDAWDRMAAQHNRSLRPDEEPIQAAKEFRGTVDVAPGLENWYGVGVEAIDVGWGCHDQESTARYAGALLDGQAPSRERGISPDGVPCPTRSAVNLANSVSEEHWCGAGVEDIDVDRGGT